MSYITIAVVTVARTAPGLLAVLNKYLLNGYVGGWTSAQGKDGTPRLLTFWFKKTSHDKKSKHKTQRSCAFLAHYFSRAPVSNTAFYFQNPS
jgi:hypothetical protein